MGALQRREDRQDDVGPRARLVQVAVDRDEQVERSNAAPRRPTFGVETSGLPATVISARIRPSPGSVISSARQETGSSPKASGISRTRVLQRPILKPRPRPAAPVEFVCAGGREREHDAAGPVEVAGDHVDHVDEPAREGPELLRRGADPRVDGGARRGGELAGDPADLGGVDPAGLRRRPRGRTARPPRRPRRARRRARRVGAGVDEALLDHRVDDRRRGSGRRGRAGSGGARRRPPRSGSGADRRRRPGRRDRGSPAACRACRAPSSASRSRRAGWRRGSACSRCGRRRGSGSTGPVPNIEAQAICLGS